MHPIQDLPPSNSIYLTVIIGLAWQRRLYPCTVLLLNGLSVLSNEFKNQNSNAAAIFDGGASHQNLIFNSNYLHDNHTGSSCVYVANCNNPEFGYNHITNGRRGFKIAGGNNAVNIHNNIITNTVKADIMVNTDFGANSAVQAHWNRLTGAITILNEDVTVVDATCNWFGSTGSLLLLMHLLQRSQSKYSQLYTMADEWY